MTASLTTFKIKWMKAKLTKAKISHCVSTITYSQRPKIKSHWPGKSLFAPVTLSFILDHTKHLTTLASALRSGHPARRQTFNISQSLLEIAPDIFSGSQLFSTLGARVQCLQTQAWANSAKEKHNSLCCAVSLCVYLFFHKADNVIHPRGSYKKASLSSDGLRQQPAKMLQFPFCVSRCWVSPNIFFFHYLLRTLQQPRLSC